MQYELFSEADFQQEQPFEGRNICLVGRFRQANKAITPKLKALGFKVCPSPVRSLHYVAMGADVSAKEAEALEALALNGYCPRILSEADLYDIFSGHYHAYAVGETITKQLHLSWRHYLLAQQRYEAFQGRLYMKELYLAPDVSADLYQALGNRGIYANTYIDDTTDVIVISEASLQALQQGQTDESLRYIEAQYNRSRSQSFRYAITSEAALRAATLSV